MEQIIEHDMELDNADATVKVLEKALTVFQIAKPLLIVFVLGIQTKKFKRFLDLVNIRRAERKLHADIVLDILVRYITGGADGQSEGMKPFKKEGNWPVRDDVEDKKNPAQLTELGARANDLSAIYDIYLDVQEMWTYWLSQNLKMK